MEELIASFIIQAKECRLRDIGKFRMVKTPAEADVANKQVKPPGIEIVFTTREEKISDGLVKYVADRKAIPITEALDDLKKWCADTKYKLKQGQEILLQPLGVLKKGASGNVFVHNATTATFFEPVFAERVIHQNSEHAMLVGDKETTSAVMNHYYQDEENTVKSNTWKILAIILIAVGLFLLFLHFYHNTFSASTFGNQNKVVPATSPNTYSTQ